MDVLCIDNKRRPYSYYDPAKYITEGETYTIAFHDIVKCYHTGLLVKGYVLDGFDKTYVFAADRFVPISDLDETTLVSEEFEEKYCETVK